MFNEIDTDRGYLPNQSIVYMTGVLEKILGIKGSREVVARYELSRIGTYSDLPIL